MGTDDFVHTLAADEANMPLYYLALRGWIALAGDGEAWMRALSALFGLGTVVSLYVLARRLFGFPVAIVASVLLATNAFFVQHAQEARSYMLAALLATLATFCFVRAVDTGTGWWLYPIAVALGVYAHFFVVLVPLAHVVSLPARPRSPELWRRVALSLGAAAILTLPYWWAAVGRGGDQIYQNPPVGLADAARMISGFAGGAGPALVLVAGLACVVVAVLAVRTGRAEGRGDALWRLVVALAALVVPVLAILATALTDRDPALRYLSFLAPALALVVARGIAVARDRRVLVAATVVVVALQAVGLRRWYRDPQKEDWRAAVELVRTDGRRGDAVVLYDADRIMLFDYYDRPAEGRGPRVASPPAGFDPFPLYEDPLILDEARLRAVAEDHDRLWYLVPNDSATDAPPPRAARLAEDLEATHPVALDRRYFRVGATLYERPG
jgi:mannosyltransferase